MKDSNQKKEVDLAKWILLVKIKINRDVQREAMKLSCSVWETYVSLGQGSSTAPAVFSS